MRAGLPLKGLEAKYHCKAREETPPLHPPRVHRKEIPGGLERDAWQVMAQLLERLGGERIDQPLFGRWSVLKDLDPEGGGLRVLPGGVIEARG